MARPATAPPRAKPCRRRQLAGGGSGIMGQLMPRMPRPTGQRRSAADGNGKGGRRAAPDLGAGGRQPKAVRVQTGIQRRPCDRAYTATRCSLACRSSPTSWRRGHHERPGAAVARQRQPLIRLRGITKVYGEGALAFQALRAWIWDIAAGEFLAIMGPSGSGKSTAM